MDPYSLRTISWIILGIGAAFTLIGTIGTLYFGKRVETIGPYIQPILLATATVEVFIESDKNENITHMNKGGYICFVKDNKPLLIMSSTSLDYSRVEGAVDARRKG